MINRRQVLKTALAAPFLTGATSTVIASEVPPPPPQGIPVIKFSGTNYIANLEEIFAGVPWTLTNNKLAINCTSQETIAWLPQDRAIDRRCLNMDDEHKWSGELTVVLFYGLVIIKRNRSNDPLFPKIIGPARIMKIPQSILLPIPSVTNYMMRVNAQRESGGEIPQSILLPIPSVTNYMMRVNAQRESDGGDL